MSESRAAKFLDLIRRSNRGRLKVYLGYGPGVGKTYQMLQEAHRLKSEGVDVVVGFVETHNRADTEALVDGLEAVPRRRLEYHGITVDEFDLDACIRRKPAVAVVDELAHTNIPGSRNAKRYQDVQELLAAGIHVITAMNVQHLESLYNTVESLIGVKVRERVPDSVLVDADQVINIDVAPEDLQKRLRDGKIYPRERIASSLENFFQSENLEHLRELALRELASEIDSRRRERPENSATGSDQIMVCLSSQGPNAARLLRFGSRLAGRLNRNWYAVYVQTPAEEATRIDAKTQRLLSDTLALANQLGATVFTFKGDDIADTIMRFAAEYRVGQIVIGKPHFIPRWRRLLGQHSVAERLIFKTSNAAVVVIDADAPNEQAAAIPANNRTDRDSSSSSSKPQPNMLTKFSFSSLLNAESIGVFEEPISRDHLFRSLIALLRKQDETIDEKKVLAKLHEREIRGSTFLNEGIGLPHARIEGLIEPRIAIGVTHAGVLDAPVAMPIEIVVLLLTPGETSLTHLQLLSATARLWQNRELRKVIQKAHSPQSVFAAISAATA